MGIPNMSLPELRPVQTESPMDQYAKALQIRQMQGQNQLQGIQTQQQQQALKDQQAGTAALHQWDGQDPDQLMKLMAKNGASINAVLQTKQHFLDTKAKYSQIAKDDAETGAKNLETMKGKNDMMVGALNTVMGAPDEQIVPTLQSTAQDLVQRGLLDPQHAQQVSQMAGLPPDQIRQKLKMFEKSYMSDTQQIEQATKEAQAYKDTQQGNEAAAKVASGAVLSPEQRSMNDWLAKNPGKGPADYEQAKESKTETTSADLFGTNTVHHTAPNIVPPGSPQSAQPKAAIVPPAKGNGKVLGAGAPTPVDVDPTGRNDSALQGLKPSDAAAIKAIADYRLNPQQFMRRPGVLAKVAEYDPSFDQQRYQLKQKTRQYFITGKGAEEVAAFKTADQHADLLVKQFDALNNGDMPAVNALKNSISAAFGSGAPVTTRAIIDAYNHEVNTAIAKGHTTDREIADRNLTLSPNASPEQVHSVLDGYRQLMQSKIRIRMNQYEAGLRGEPAFGQAAPGGGQQQAAPQGGGWAEQFGGTSHK